ncbi:MAG: exodeoxyribonuclease VII small subunit [Anaerolineae bacterium]|nr:MAG: exodeoxyribonuclease VII small subunit [Anaerolineae bacterium]
MAKAKPVEDLSYEEAFADLEAVVAALESADHPLEESLALFERGQALARRCAELLEKAELKVEQLTGDGELSDFEE